MSPEREAWVAARAEYFAHIGRELPEGLRSYRERAYEAAKAVYEAEGAWPRATELPEEMR